MFQDKFDTRKERKEREEKGEKRENREQNIDQTESDRSVYCLCVSVAGVAREEKCADRFGAYFLFFMTGSVSLFSPLVLNTDPKSDLWPSCLVLFLPRFRS